VKPVGVVSGAGQDQDQLLAMPLAAGAGDKDKALELSRAARERHFSTPRASGDASAYGNASRAGSGVRRAGRSFARIVAVGERTPAHYRNISALAREFQQMPLRRFPARHQLRARGFAPMHHHGCKSWQKAVPQFEETNDRLKRIVKPFLDTDAVPSWRIHCSTRDGNKQRSGPAVRIYCGHYRGGLDANALKYGQM